MCLGCVVYEGAPTDYLRSVILLNLCGLQAVEASHANPAWVHGNRLVIPQVWGCACQSCDLKSRKRGQDGPWTHDLMRARVLDLEVLGKDGEALVGFLQERESQVSQTVHRLSEALKSQGVTWDALSRWGPTFLTHRYGLSPETIASWCNDITGVHIDPPFPGFTKALCCLNKVYEGLPLLLG